MTRRTLTIQLYFAILSENAQMTHPSGLDELVEVDKKRLTCLASDASDNLVVEGDIDTVALVPCEDQKLAAADIDLMVMSCLRDFKKGFVEKLRIMNECLTTTYRAQAGFDPQAAACLSKLIKECRILAVLELVVETRHTLR